MISPPADIDQNIHLAAQLIKESHYTIALTGAGISTPSGIPDFRSPGEGLWRHLDPMEVASLTAFRHNPESFYKWFHPVARLIHTANPNPAHLALAQLQSTGYLSTIITQNIDGLHGRAGAVNVLEVHGTLDSLTCTNCYHKIQASTIMEAYLSDCCMPHCEICGSIMKPDVILYEEQLPYSIWHQAEEAGRNCDLIVVVGTSLEVMPTARLPVQAMDHGARLIILNNAETFMDVRADVVIRADVASILPQIVDQILPS